jgi:addiction module HigA family antidote
MIVIIFGVTRPSLTGRTMTRTAIHPGEQLAKYLSDLDMSATELGRQIKVPANRITEILNKRRAITGDTALRLGHFFGTSPDYWLNLQAIYELCLAEQKSGPDIRNLPRLQMRKMKQGSHQPATA